MYGVIRGSARGCEHPEQDSLDPSRRHEGLTPDGAGSLLRRFGTLQRKRGPARAGPRQLVPGAAAARDSRAGLLGECLSLLHGAFEGSVGILGHGREELS